RTLMSPLPSQCYPTHLDLHPFPTRRSSDLSARLDRRDRRSACGAHGGLAHDDESGVLTRAHRALRARVARVCALYFSNPALPRRSEEHTSELQSRENLVCRLLLEKKNNSFN